MLSGARHGAKGHPFHSAERAVSAGHPVPGALAEARRAVGTEHPAAVAAGASFACFGLP